MLDQEIAPLQLHSFFVGNGFFWSFALHQAWTSVYWLEVLLVSMWYTHPLFLLPNRVATW